MVVLDLPDHLSGIELVPKLRRRAPRSTIVVTSAAASRAAAPAATALGATCYVQHARKRGVRRLAAVLARLAQSSANRPVAPI